MIFGVRLGCPEKSGQFYFNNVYKEKGKVMITPETLACVTEHFNEDYFNIHQFLLANGDNTGSRNGTTSELLNFKTIVSNPIKRCVGGYNRNINIFFLLAEALWIYCGRRDVAFLDTFNSQLKQYSDDGINYHAPYGWRLRNWGVDSMSRLNDANKHYFQGTDQLQTAIEMLSRNPEDRRVVLAIWNADLDLNTTSKDLPCNDLLMFKVRKGRLYSTIANRSNDLNLGLTTNVFQFSFVGEIVARILDVGMGDQVHNSQSLHLYLNHELTGKLTHEFVHDNGALLYDQAKPNQMDFNFAAATTPSERLRLVDFHLNSVLAMISNEVRTLANNQSNSIDESYPDELKKFSRYFYFVYELLRIYVRYKNNNSRVDAMLTLEALMWDMPEYGSNDYLLLAFNFFISRSKSKTELELSKRITTDYQQLKQAGNY